MGDMIKEIREGKAAIRKRKEERERGRRDGREEKKG
jgi:hypothetical protein